MIYGMLMLLYKEIEYMEKTKKFLTVMLSTCFAFGLSIVTMDMATASAEASPVVENYDADKSTRGIYTSLSLSLNGGESKVWATVKNDLT